MRRRSRNGKRLSREGGWKSTTIDQEVMAGNEARMGGAEKRASRAKLFRPADAFGRNRFDPLRPHRLRRRVVTPRISLEQRL